MYAGRLYGNFIAEEIKRELVEFCLRVIGEEINVQKLVLREKFINLIERNYFYTI